MISIIFKHVQDCYCAMTTDNRSKKHRMKEHYHLLDHAGIDYFISRISKDNPDHTMYTRSINNSTTNRDRGSKTG